MSTTVDSPARLPLRCSAPVPRHGGLEWLRVWATILVVLLHAGIPYLTHPLPGVVWSVESAERSSLVNLCCWWINGFIMPLFFLMCGFFACDLHRCRGADGFLRHRLHRIGGPLLFGIVVILPLDLYAWLLGWAQQGWIPLQKLRSLKVDPSLSRDLWGLAHLWFLEYLLLYCVGAWMICRVLERRAARVDSHRTLAMIPPAANERTCSVTRSLLAAGAILIGAIAICGTVLTVQPRIVIGFRHSWLPLWENALYYAVPFVMGWAWSAFRSRNVLAEGRSPHRAGTFLKWLPAGGLAVATVVFIVMLPRLEAHLAQNNAVMNDPWLPFLFSGFGLLMSVSLFGTALTMGAHRAPDSVRYFAQATFWIYLLHHPLVGLVHVDLWALTWSVEVKFLVAAVVPLTICLLTYEVAVRRTVIGIVLNGRHSAQRRDVAPAGPPIQAVPTRRAA